LEQLKRLSIRYKKYFWDCDFDKLDLTIHKEYVLNRFLSLGDLSGIHFIFKNFSQNEIFEYLKAKGVNALSRTNYLFWQKLIKHDELWQK